MNLLAKAFTCLTDPVAKETYDAALWAGRNPVAVTATADSKPLVESVSAAPTDPLAWLFGPWSTGTLSDSSRGAVVENWITAPPPQRSPMEVAPAVPAHAVEDRNGQVDAKPSPQAPPADKSAPPPPDPLTKIATSALARQGLGTKRAMYQRLARTRELYRAWNAAGKYLGHPERRLIKSTEAVEIARQLTHIRRRLREFPPLLGAAGQPGFYVVTLSSQPRKGIVATFRILLPSQRAMLARDWRDGLKLLAAHRRFLSEEIRALRQASWLSRALRAVDTVLSDHPGWLLGAIVLVALVVATSLALSQ
jgi:hypothetical protein